MPITDITPMNQQILSLGSQVLEAATLESTADGLGGPELDQAIDRAIEALFDDLGGGDDTCLNYYCTGYWPTGSFGAADDDALPS